MIHNDSETLKQFKIPLQQINGQTVRIQHMLTKVAVLMTSSFHIYQQAPHTSSSPTLTNDRFDMLEASFGKIS